MEAVTPFHYRSFPLSLHAGKGALDQLRGEVDRAKAKRAFVVCGKSVAGKTDLIARVKANLGDKFAGVFDGVVASSPLPSVLAGTAAAREAGADLIVAVGGGSAMVTPARSSSFWQKRATSTRSARNTRPARLP